MFFETFVKEMSDILFLAVPSRRRSMYRGAATLSGISRYTGHGGFAHIYEAGQTSV